jgi:hypothetical protein
MSEISRREVVKALGLVPLAGALGACTSPETDRAARAAASAGDAAAAGGFFTPHEGETVRVLVDYVIPRDERSGSATDAKVPEFMDVFLAHPETPPEDGLAIRGGLAWLDAECVRRHGATFVRATDAQRRAVLDDIAWPAKARPEMSHGVAFFNRFRDLTASGFFSSQVGYRDLQYQGNVALPEWSGCPAAALQKLGVSEDVMAAGRRSGARATDE